MSSLKLFVQLPAIIFYIFITLTVTQAWSNDHVTTYQLTSGNGDPYGTLVIPARSRGGLHLLLPEFIPADKQQEAGAREATDRKIGVIRHIPDSDHRGIFKNYMEVYHPDAININPDDLDMGDVGTIFLTDTALPSYDVLSGLLSSSPIENRDDISLSLPIPKIEIPVHSQGRLRIMTMSGDIRNPAVTSTDNSRFTVSGYSWGVVSDVLDNRLSHFDRYRQIEVQADFIYNSADGSVQLESFRMGDYITISHVSNEESSEYNTLMESLWVQLERYQAREEKSKIRQKRKDEYMNSLGESDRELLYSHLRFLDHVEHPRRSIVIEDPERAEQLYQALQAFMDDENTHTQSADSGGNNAGAESTVPEGDDVEMELEPGTAGNGSVSNDPENRRIELLRDGRLWLSLGLQSNLK